MKDRDVCQIGHTVVNALGMAGIVFLALGGLALPGCSGNSSDDDEPLIVPEEDAGSTDGGTTDGGSTDGGSTDCGEGMTFCDGRCVDTTSSADHCGGCGNSCQSEATCMEGSCTRQPEDCREEPCKGLTYCDLNTGDCKPGCSSDDQCSSNEKCNTAAHECVCVSGTKRFKGACVNESQCNEQFCSGSQYCDLGAGKCRSGCHSDGQCGSGEKCDTSSNECVCVSGKSRFKGKCVDEQECNQQFCSGDQYCDFANGTCRAGCHSDDQCGNNQVCNTNTNACTCNAQTQRFNGECLDTQTCNQKHCSEYEYCDFSSSSCRTGCYKDSQCGSNGSCNMATNECSCDSGYVKSGYGCLARSSTVDTLTRIGSSISLEVDRSGHVHIAYPEIFDDHLKYAEWNGRKWTKKTFSSSNERDAYSSLAVDASGNPHISYYDKTAKNLIYATRSGGTWNVEKADDSGSVGKRTAIAVDGSEPHIVYYDTGNEKYKHAEKTAGSWNRETVGKSADVRRGDTAIGVDSSGDLGIGYVHTDPRVSGNSTYKMVMSFAERSGAGWSSTKIASDTRVVGAALAFDANDTPHLAYMFNENVYHAEQSGSGWTTTEIGSSSASSVSVAIDAQDRPHVVFNREGLRHAWWDGSSWRGEKISTPSDASSDPTIDIYNGRAYIAYHKWNEDKLLLSIVDL